MHASGRSGAAPDGPPTVARPEGLPGHPRVPLGDDCWFLSGPTASGKSSLAIPLARRLGAEIVSVDSMAVYRGLDIGTAKPTPEQRQAVPHHVLDVVTAAEPYSVARWLADAAAALADCRSRGRGILFVGGTPLYLRALRDGLAPLPPADPGLRAALAAEADQRGPEALHARLATIDPVAATRIHPRDAKRIMRALEVADVTGRPLSEAFAPAPDPIFEQRLMVVDVPRAALYRRIDQRVQRMFSDGIIDETRAALAAPGGIGPTAGQAAGYAETIALLEGRVDLAEAVRGTQQRTRQLAKRQLTWLRSFAGATWITA
ncbi:MAG: tRNA (adenosine(37)-N6)-dimethylallyltransferase MiaA [Planctomycetaceae bacterium]